MTCPTRTFIAVMAALVAWAQAAATGQMATRRFGSPPKGAAARASAGPPKAQVPTGYVVQAKTAPVVDGKLDDAAWQSAQPLRLARSLDGGSPAAQPTEVRLLRDQTRLYVAFRCTEPLMNKLNSGSAGKDVDVWSNDSVEFFLGLGASYCHFGVNAAGGTYDARGKDKDFDSGMKAAVTKAGGEWTVEVAIPLEKMADGKQTPTEWTGNFHRNRQTSGDLEESAWSPTFSGDSHVPEKFGKLVLGNPPAAAPGEKPVEVPKPAVKGKSVEILPVSNGEAIVKFDLTELTGARILRADLLIFRTAPVDGRLDETLGEVSIDAPVAGVVGVGQGAARDVGGDPHVVELGAGRAQRGLDVPETLTVGQLGEGHAEELIQAGEALDLVVASISLNAGTEASHRQEVHHLREQGASGIQGLILQNDQSEDTAKMKSMTPFYERNCYNISEL